MTQGDTRWYYVRNGERQGPVSEAAIKVMLDTQQLAPSDFVWNEAMPDWREAREITQFAAATSAPSAPASAAPAYPQQPAPGPAQPGPVFQQPAPGPFAQPNPASYPPNQPPPGYAPQPGPFAPPPGYGYPYAPPPYYYGPAPQPVIPLDPRLTSGAQTIYILYIIGLFVPFFLTTIGVIIAYSKRGTEGPGMDSHYTWLIYTYWISWLWLLIGMVTVFIFVGFFVLLFAWIWELVRVVMGLSRLGRNEGIPNPYDWFFQ